MSNVCSPLRYPGGKNCIFKFVSSLMLENGLKGFSYAEPFAGGAGLALRLLLEGYAESIHINDFDRAVYAFWATITERPGEFCEWIESVDISMANWWHYKGVIDSDYSQVDLFELAKAAFFLNRTNVSGIIKGGPIGGYEEKGKYKLDARFTKKTLIKRIQRIAAVKDRISVTNLDALDFLQEMNQKENVFVYLDPPYYKKSARLYMNFYQDEDHQRLAEEVAGLSVPWMVSYDNQPFILDMYGDRQRLVYQLFQSTSNSAGDEIVVFSDGLKYKEAIAHLKAPKLLEASAAL